MSFLLVGTYWPWSAQEAGRSQGRDPAEESPRASGNARVKAVVRTDDGRLHKFTEVPTQLTQPSPREPLGIRLRTRHGVSLVFPAVHVSIHI